MDSRTINAISICSGIGGLDRGVRRVLPTARVVLYCEREISAAAILASRMETQDLDSAAIWSDLESITGPECSDYIREATGGRGIDMLFGGPPCQGFSVAGKQLGADDERDMFPATLRAIEHYKPWCVFLENVPGSCGYVSERVIPALCGMGYRVPRPILLEAAAIGASQKRERLFILAVHESAGRWLRRRSNGSETPKGEAEIREWGLREQQRPAVNEQFERHLPAIPLAIDAEPRSRRISESARRYDAADVDGSGGGMGLANKPGSQKRRGNGRIQPGTRKSGKGEAAELRGGNVGDARLNGGGSREHEVFGEATKQAARDAVDSVSRRRRVFGAYPPGPGLGLDRVVDKVLASLEAGEDDAGDCFLAELAEWAKWQRILEVRPDLAPATVERPLRDVADGISRGLDDVSRADKLRALGNAVVADQAELALRILFSRIGL